MHPLVNIPPVSILLIDDHSLVAEGFSLLLNKMLPQGSRISVSDSVEKAKTAMAREQYDFVLTDLIMPGQQVTELIADLRTRYPELIMLVVSSVIDTNTIKECLTLGVNGYISKGSSPGEIRLALENTYNGRKFISSDLSGRLASSILSIESSELTKRELEVLRLIVAGHKIKAVAEKLHVSPVTIMTHKRNLMQKLKIHTAVGLVKYAYDNHLI